MNRRQVFFPPRSCSFSFYTSKLSLEKYSLSSRLLQLKAAAALQTIAMNRDDIRLAAPPTDEKEDLSTCANIAIVVVSIVVVLAIAFLVVLCCAGQSRREAGEESSSM